MDTKLLEAPCYFQKLLTAIFENKKGFLVFVLYTYIEGVDKSDI